LIDLLEALFSHIPRHQGQVPTAEDLADVGNKAESTSAHASATHRVRPFLNRAMLI
jgi:hypothetical protein